MGKKGPVQVCQQITLLRGPCKKKEQRGWQKGGLRSRPVILMPFPKVACRLQNQLPVYCGQCSRLT